jgi:hypothetical protein
VAAAASNHEQTIFQRHVLLPKWKSWSKSEWSWRRTSLLVMAGIALVDSLFIPMSRDVDPGRSAEGILFLVLGFRAASRRIDPPGSVVIAAAGLVALTASLNHMLLKSPSWIWTPAGFLLLAFVMFKGRGKPRVAKK